MEENNQSGMKSAFRNAPLAIGTLLIITLLAACDRNSSDATQPPAVNRISLASLKLNGLKSCDAYKTYVTDALVEQYRPHPGSSLPVESMPGAPQSAPTSAGDAAGASSSAPTHVTGTNNQEPGVDEPDIVKTDMDGNLYIARGNFLRIVAGHPPAALKELAALDAGGTVYDLFLDAKQHRAVLFAAHYGEPVPVSPPSAGDVITLPAFYHRVQYVVSFVDVTDPAKPILTTRWTLDGFPLDARRVDARIHVALSDPLELPVSLKQDTTFWKLYSDYYNAPNTDAANALEQKIVTAIRAALAPMDASQLLPNMTITKGSQTVIQPMVSCGDISAPTVLTRPSLLTVASFDTDGGNLNTSAITAEGATVYASPTNLYVTQYSGGWFNNAEYHPQTAIHKFSVSGTAPKYVATGVVDGWARNSYNFSEFNNDLRVATHTDIWSNGASTRTNDLFILRDNGSGELASLSAVRDFGKGESMFGVRFLGSRGFVVTFRNVDPLFAFDLSNPDQPKLAGELTIPGFSTYMHPLGKNHILTIGRDGTNWGTQLQIFDVSNLAKPTLAHTFAPKLPSGNYSYSNAEYDPHAFTFDATNNVLAIPLAYSDSTQYFNGIAAFSVDAITGIKDIVRVDHADLANKANCDPAAPVVVPCNYWGSASPSRSVIMTAADTGVTLYSISHAGVKATALAPPNLDIGSVVFPLDPLHPPIAIRPSDTSSK